MSGFAAKTLTLGAIILIILGIGVFEAHKDPELDDNVRAALREIGMSRTYAMQVNTRVRIDDRDLAIEGLYYIDTPLQAYASQSTTTLTTESGETHAFTLKNVSLGEMVYVSVATESALLMRTLPLTNGWQSFASAEIPQQFAGIAVHGPILDNARIFAEEGAYLEFVEEIEGDEGVEYVFKLKDPRAEPGGTLGSLFGRIGVQGFVKVWLEDGRVTRTVFSGEGYTSTTTFISGVFSITPPL
jgi:hypothetical protein